MLSITFDGIEYRFYDHLYAVSACGLVLRQLQPYTPKLRPDGYLAIGRRRLLHRMVATCWIDKPNTANHVHHKNEIKSDNRASNLEWITPKAHNAHHKNSAGHTMSESGRQKLRSLRLGSKTSESTKQKQREATIRLGLRPPAPTPGYKHSKEAIAKMVKNSPNATACEIDGIVYQSFSQAGHALGIKPHTLRKRCLSTNFPTYRLIGD